MDRSRMWLYEASWRDRELAKAWGTLAGGGGVGGCGTREEGRRSRRVVFRTKEGRREGGTVSVWQSAARCLLLPLSFFFFSFLLFFFHLYRKNWPDPCVSLPHPLFTLCFRRYIRRWKEQCDLIVPFHFISDTIASVIFIESCVRAYVCMCTISPFAGRWNL